MQSTELAVSNDEFGESKLHPTAWWCFGDLLWCNSSLSMPIKREGASLSSCVIDKNSPWEKWNWVIRYHIGTSSQLLLVYYMWAKRKTILTTYCYILGYSPKDRNKLSLVVPCVSYLPISTFTDICWPRSERSSPSWPNVVGSTPLIPGTSPAPPWQLWGWEILDRSTIARLTPDTGIGTLLPSRRRTLTRKPNQQQQAS